MMLMQRGSDCEAMGAAGVESPVIKKLSNKCLKSAES